MNSALDARVHVDSLYPHFSPLQSSSCEYSLEILHGVFTLNICCRFSFRNMVKGVGTKSNKQTMQCVYYICFNHKCELTCKVGIDAVLVIALCTPCLNRA